jgi:hypothetical protein
MSVPLAEPPTVVALLEFQERLAEVFDGLERVHPEELFCERPDEALGDPVGQSNRLHTVRPIRSEGFRSPIRFIP